MNIPLLYHWYAGVPPLVGLAVKVTEVPAQTPLVDAPIVIPVVYPGLTVTGKSTG